MDLLNVRNMLKKRKPTFLAQDWYKRKRVRRRWRKPRGLHSKMRLQKRGKPARVSSGWRSPRAVRGLTRHGLSEVIIRTVRDLDLLGEGKIGVFHGQVGLRTRLTLIKIAEERGLQLDARQVARAKARAAAYEEKRKEMAKKKETKKETVEENAGKKKNAGETSEEVIPGDGEADRGENDRTGKNDTSNTGEEKDKVEEKENDEIEEVEQNETPTGSAEEEPSEKNTSSS